MPLAGGLVDCLAFHESNNNPFAVGSAGEIGILQFQPGTFNSFCVKKYHLPDDIWNPAIQKDCCAKMIQDGLVYHWTTRSKCL